MEEYIVAVHGPYTSDISATHVRERTKILNLGLAAALDLQKEATEWLPYR